MNIPPLTQISILAIEILATLLQGCGTIATSSQPSQGSTVLTLSGSGGINHPSVVTRPYVVLVSLDGFHPDYLGRFDTPAFDQLTRTGVIADGLISVFPSLTFPSHYSIATGLYPERHGIVGNRFHDPTRGEDFNYRDQDDVQDGTWWKGEPIWVTAERQGMVTASVFFPGTQAAIKNVYPTYWRPYNSRLPNTKRVEQVIEWLQAPASERPHLIMVYFSIVDSVGHRDGPNGPKIRSAVTAVDRLLGQLMNTIEQLPYGPNVYLVVTSDHGMAVVDPERQVVISDIINLDGIRAIPTGPGMNLYLEGDAEHSRWLRDTFNRRTNLATAFLRQEVPDYLHYRASQRIGDVVILPEEGASVSFSQSAPPMGMHGWDPNLTSMHGIFLMRGPTISPSQHIQAFENIHIYPLLAQILELEPAAEIDGQIDVLRTLLEN